jgi:hypothetical protein
MRGGLSARRRTPKKRAEAKDRLPGLALYLNYPSTSITSARKF